MAGKHALAAGLPRDRVPGELTGPHYFPTVYCLQHDDAAFGFAPSFDGYPAFNTQACPGRI